MTQPGQPPTRLFEPGFVALLESLTLAGRRVPAGRAAGQWRSRTNGSSVEFADYRTYAPGDDYRRIDWNAYARLERLFVRLYQAEEDLALSLLLDTSASMAWGRPTKGRVAAQVAGALAFVGLRRGDRVALGLLRAGQASRPPAVGELRGAAAARAAWHALERLDFGDATDLQGALSSAAQQVRGAGLTVVLSDLLSPTGYQPGLDALRARRQEVVVIQVLSPDELDPPADLLGDWRLIDSEPAAPLEASITPAVLRSYRRLIQTYTAEARDFCRRRGVTFLQLRSDTPVTTIVLRSLRAAGILV
jgi:uncharacterized protein (DUF58 family)